MEDITPKYLRDEVRFKDKFRGYDPDEVDDLIDRVADHLERLEEQLRRAQQALAQRPQAGPAAAARQAAAPPAPAPAPAAPVSQAPSPAVARGAAQPAYDEEARQILVLAQRTASEARREARDHASKIVAEAENRAAVLKAEADEQVRLNAERAQRQLRHDVEALTERRRALQSDVGELQRHAAETRSVLTRVLEGQLERLSSLRDDKLPVAPALSAADPEPLPEPTAPALSAPAPEFDAARAPQASPSQEPPVISPARTQEPATAPAAPVTPTPVSENAPPVVAPAPLDAPEWADDVADPDDPWLAELQRAHTDQTPLGPRDFDSDRYLVEPDDDAGRRGLFRRR